MIIDNHNKGFIEKLKELKQSGNWTNILIIGSVGTGKTYTVKHLFPEAYFINEGTFKQNLSSGILKLCPPDLWASRSAYPLEMLCKKEVVVYDDIGVADITEGYIDKMMYWLDERLQKGKKTIFTTNLTMEDLEKREKRIASRIQENCKILVLSGNDRRKQSREVFKY